MLIIGTLLSLQLRLRYIWVFVYFKNYIMDQYCSPNFKKLARNAAKVLRKNYKKVSAQL